MWSGPFLAQIPVTVHPNGGNSCPAGTMMGWPIPRSWTAKGMGWPIPRSWTAKGNGTFEFTESLLTKFGSTMQGFVQDLHVGSQGQEPAPWLSRSARSRTATSLSSGCNNRILFILPTTLIQSIRVVGPRIALSR